MCAPTQAHGPGQENGAEAGGQSRVQGMRLRWETPPQRKAAVLAALGGNARIFPLLADSTSVTFRRRAPRLRARDSGTRTADPERCWGATAERRAPRHARSAEALASAEPTCAWPRGRAPSQRRGEPSESQRTRPGEEVGLRNADDLPNAGVTGASAGSAPRGQTPPAGRSAGRSRPVHSPARYRRCPRPGPPSGLAAETAAPGTTLTSAAGERAHTPRGRGANTPGRAGPAVGTRRGDQRPAPSPAQPSPPPAARRDVWGQTRGRLPCPGEAKPSGAPLRGRRVCAPCPRPRPGALPPHTRPHRGCAPGQRVRACTRLSPKRTLA